MIDEPTTARKNDGDILFPFLYLFWVPFGHAVIIPDPAQKVNTFSFAIFLSVSARFLLTSDDIRCIIGAVSAISPVSHLNWSCYYARYMILLIEETIIEKRII